ncbi:putative leucine-rich repeat-containing protein DDB_G0290503 [Polyergus mexicanus]|uniref:putative leucine-rich repeat-containing protein DDB_G0290503 n=1 Tax=Polyergus mexicanus TaxID=615972 RepID=UPI0038B46C7E
MLSEAVMINPSEKAEDRPSSNSSRKSATFSIGNKTHKSRIPTTQIGRNAMQGDSPMYEESSSGISSNNNSARRPSMTPNISLYNRKPTNAITAEKRQLEIQYSSKKLRYANLKRTLADKQKIAQDLYDEISSLREKIITAGGKDPGKIEEPKLSQVECPKQNPPTSIETNLHDNGQWEQICMDESMVIGVSLLQNQLQNLCDRSQELCQRALDKSSSFASFVKSWLTESHQQDEMDNRVDCKVSILVDYSKAEMQQTILAQSNEELKMQLDQLRTAQNDFIAEYETRSSNLRIEYDNYLRQMKKEQPNVEYKDLQEQLNAALQKLKTERDKASQGKERMRMIELQMQKARTKIRELEGHVANEELKSQQLQNGMKSLEVQLKQKDQTMELRMKDMNKALKSSEDLITKMEKQRNTFESRMLELKQRMVHKEVEANTTIKELSEKFEAIDKEINEEREKRQQAESALTEIEERCKHLEEKSQLLCDLANEKSNNIAVTDNNHTENEICLYNDLTAARAELEHMREKIEQLEREKQEIVTVMHQAASDSEDETKDKLAAELIAKTNDLQNLLLEHAQLQKIARFTQERNEVLENQLSEIQRHLYAKSKEGGKTEFDTIELQQQVCDLRNSLTEAMQQNQELETTLTQKQLELEQRDRVMREQSKFLKARDELLTLLKGKQANVDNLANENYEDIDEINKQIAAKTEAIQELYTTLENKQMQVMRLEKLVKLLEDQQDRAQAQRTRLEHRIAQLEISLREKNNNNRTKAFGIL